MDTRHYDRFKELAASGRKSEAKSALAQFLASFASDDEKRRWARDFLAARAAGERIRHEIYQELIFPTLRDGYRAGDPWSTAWLARTAQNLYAASRLHEQIGFKTERELLMECIALDPDSHEVRQDLLRSLIDWFGQCLHAWPTGVLYGMDGASQEDCGTLLEEIAKARSLDSEGLHEAFLSDVEAKVVAYRNRLRGG